MSHRAALYTVRVKRKRHSEFCLLGDIDGGGQSLIDFVAQCVIDMDLPPGEGDRLVRHLDIGEIEGAVSDDEFATMLQHGETGLAADLVDEHGDQKVRQVSSDTHLVRCACLFRLPPTHDMGWLSLHVNNNRGVKSSLEKHLLGEFGRRFDELMLQITPFVDMGSLRKAIDQDRINNVRLVRYERPKDRADEITDEWLGGENEGKIELRLSPMARAGRLKGKLVRRFLDATDDAARRDARDKIVEFHGISFDTAKVEVVLPDGRRRTVHLDSPKAGHPMHVELDGLGFDGEGEPAPASLFDGLRTALDDALDE